MTIYRRKTSLFIAFILALIFGTKLDAADYPRIYFDAADLPRLQAKAMSPRPDQPKVNWNYALLRDADTYLTTDFSDPNLNENDKDGWARLLAAAALFGGADNPNREAYIAKAKEALLNINNGVVNITVNAQNPRRLDKWKWDGSTNVHAWSPGGILMYYCEAFDYLMALGALNPSEIEIIRSRLLILAHITRERARRNIQELKDYHDGLTIVISNMRHRMVGGLGIVALTFPDQDGPIPDPENLLNGETYNLNTQELLQWVIDDLFVHDNSMWDGDDSGRGLIANYVNEDGSYKEGPSYQSDSFSVVTPFLRAYLKKTGINYLTGGNGFDDRLSRMYEWNIKVMMPNYTNPSVNTGWYPQSAWGHELVAPFMRRPSWHHWYINQARNGSMDSIYSILFYEFPSYDPPAPDIRTEFLPKSGQAVFRDKWGPDATYMHIMAEHEPIRGHRQGDQTSFSIFSRGSYMALDPGDGRNYNGGEWFWMWSAYAHNLITVDPPKPPISSISTDDFRNISPSRTTTWASSIDPAYLKNYFAHKEMDYTEAWMDYSNPEGVSIIRHFAFVRHKYFVIWDQMATENSHVYRWQLHLGEKTSDGQLRSSGYRNYSWETPGLDGRMTSLDVHFLKGIASSNVYNDAPTNHIPSETFDHTLIIGNAQGKSPNFLTLLSPRWKDEAPLSATELFLGRAWKVTVSPTEYDIIIQQPSQNLIRVDRVSTDAKYLIASFTQSGTDSRLTSLLAKGASFINVIGPETLNFNPPTLDVMYWEEGIGDIEPEPGSGSDPKPALSVEILGNPLYPGDKGSALLHYEANESGQLKIEVYTREGARVATLVDKQVTAPTASEALWDGKNESGTTVASGIYIIRAKLNGNIETKKLAIIK